METGASFGAANHRQTKTGDDMNFILAPFELLTDHNLTDTERRVLLALYSFRNRNTDLVWPSLARLSQLTGIADIARISKITKSLHSKGWLTRQRRGWGANNRYALAVPEPEISESLIRQNLPNLAKSADLVKNTKSDLVNFAKSKKHTNKQTNNILGEVEQKTPKAESVIEYKKIVDSYNEILGETLRKVRDITEQRKKHIRARIQDDPRRADPQWWAKYFEFVSHSDFLMGDGPTNPATGKPWAADFDWLTNATNMTKTLERKYHG